MRNFDEEFNEHIASQMMKSGNKGDLQATKNQLENFKQRHLKHIEWAAAKFKTKEFSRSAAVPAVIVKCLIKYDHEKVMNFCRSLKAGLFNGTNDPVFLLWKFLQKNRGWDSSNVYRVTVCAARAYMENRTLLNLIPAKKDIFDWDEGFTVPDNLLKNWKPDEIPDESKK